LPCEVFELDFFTAFFDELVECFALDVERRLDDDL